MTTDARTAPLVGCLLFLGACAGSDPPVSRAQPPVPRADPAAVEVMVLGTYHMANPGQDLTQVRVDDVTTPRRQRELAALADRLATFRPTKIAIERQAKGPDFAVAGYRAFTTAMLTSDRDEGVQIGFRLAHELGHRAVYGFDEQPGPGEPDYFPFDKVQAYAKANGKAAWLERLFQPIQAEMAAFEREQPKRSVSALLWRQNDPTAIAAMHRSGYYELLKLGDGEAQPGADLNAMWYLRNAKMFAKLTHLAVAGDRVLVIVGSGHVYWLRHFAETTPGFRFTSPLQYLEAPGRGGS